MNPLSPLIEQLSQFPGVGEKSAQRMAFFLLSLPKERVRKMGETIVETRDKIRYCEHCFNISLTPRCFVCDNPMRNTSQLCIVASPKDIFALEKSGEYKGLYHVLGGLLSPIDGIHPEALRIEELMHRCESERFQEVIFAINASIEGEATMLYLNDLLSRYSCSITKLAYGLPVGGEIDYADEITLQRAMAGRRKIGE